LAVRFVGLGVEYPGADRGRLIGQQIALLGFSASSALIENCPSGLFGSLAGGVALLLEGGFYGSNVCGDAMSFRRWGFFHGYLVKMRH
jgi:hypothetical protein